MIQFCLFSAITTKLIYGHKGKIKCFLTSSVTCNMPYGCSPVLLLITFEAFDIAFDNLMSTQLKLVICADWTYSQHFCCALPCEHWDADPCSFSLEPHRHIIGLCYISDHHKDSYNLYSCQGIWLQQQDISSCKIFMLWLDDLLLVCVFWHLSNSKLMYMCRLECLWPR